MFTQTQILELLRPALQSEGAVFQKNKNVFARPAAAGEKIQTQTNDGLETVNTAEENDFVVRNQTEAGEEYLVPGHKFTKKYSHLRDLEHNWAEYQSLGRIIALELTADRLAALNLPETFEFTAPWNELMPAKAGDFLCSPPDLSEVYRVARKEFFETYVSC